jgi:N6-adenosine-specific RNA methylase IME4
VLEWLEKDAHVYLWATTAELRNGFALFDHWGIQSDETIVWNKVWPNGQPRMGMGFPTHL